MQNTSLLYRSLAAAALCAGSIAGAHAANGAFYDPSNVASPTGYTVGHELFRTIGCPGRALLDKPCEVTDRDGDGVYDYQDKCPDVYAKTPDGCPLPEEAAPAPVAAPAPAPAPVPAEPAPAPVMIELRGANFDFDKSNIRPDDVANLDQAVATLKEWGEVNVEVAGHTDSIGTEAYNQGLSERRAQAVRNYLVDKGISAERLTVKGYGETRPVADNATAEGRFQNRRVELIQQK